MTELVGPGVCVVCWHAGHAWGECGAEEQGPYDPEDDLSDAPVYCECRDYVTKETRGRIEVRLPPSP